MLSKTTVISALIAGAMAADYHSGEVKTTQAFTYGKFSTRMRTDFHKATVASFFTYWNGPGWEEGGWNEIDIEIVPSENPAFSTNIIYGAGSGSGYNIQEQEYVGFTDVYNWHTYDIEWTPDYVKWVMDGQTVRELWRGDRGVDFLTKPCVLMMNYWIPTFPGWGDGFESGGMPWYTQYDWVETYTYNEYTQNFDFAWRDDFDSDSVDTSKWLISDNWTFGDNNVMFVKDHVFNYNGMLHLKMTSAWDNEAEELVQTPQNSGKAISHRNYIENQAQKVQKSDKAASYERYAKDQAENVQKSSKATSYENYTQNKAGKSASYEQYAKYHSE